MTLRLQAILTGPGSGGSRGTGYAQLCLERRFLQYSMWLEPVTEVTQAVVLAAWPRARVPLSLFERAPGLAEGVRLEGRVLCDTRAVLAATRWGTLLLRVATREGYFSGCVRPMAKGERALCLESELLGPGLLGMPADRRRRG